MQQLPATIGHDGKYRIEAVLGHGGFATVYKANQVALDKHVAIKVLRAEVLDRPNDLERFQREARTIARLEGHPNVIRVYDYGEQDGLAYLVMEYVEGDTLQRRLEQPLGRRLVLRVVDGVASALDFAHQRGLVHRDVKPSNVLMGRDDRVILTDFGIAKLLDDTASLTGGGTVGTPHYMAPEQIEGKEVSPATDVYALGIICYQLVAGTLPFTGSTVTVMHKQLHEPPPPLSQPGRPVSEEAEAVIRRALAKAPGDRFATAGELAAALEVALAQMLFAAPLSVLALHGLLRLVRRVGWVRP